MQLSRISASVAAVEAMTRPSISAELMHNAVKQWITGEEADDAGRGALVQYHTQAELG